MTHPQNIRNELIKKKPFAAFLLVYNYICRNTECAEKHCNQAFTSFHKLFAKEECSIPTIDFIKNCAIINNKSKGILSKNKDFQVESALYDL